MRRPSISVPFALALPLALALAPASIPSLAQAATHTVNQVGLSFQPDSINVEVGDTVEWVHGAGSHTVTNGEGAADPNAGVLFDFPFSSGSVVFTFTTAERVPYFCRPHEGAGMKGVIIVEDSALPAPGPDVHDQEWARVKARYR